MGPVNSAPLNSDVSEKVYDELRSLVESAAESSNLEKVVRKLQTFDLEQKKHILTVIRCKNVPGGWNELNLLCRATDGATIVALLESLPEEERLGVLLAGSHDRQGSTTGAPVFFDRSKALCTEAGSFIKSLLETLNVTDRVEILRQQCNGGSTVLHKLIGSYIHESDCDKQRETEIIHNVQDIIRLLDPTELTFLLQIGTRKGLPVAHAIMAECCSRCHIPNAQLLVSAVYGILPVETMLASLETTDGAGCSLFSKILRAIHHGSDDSSHTLFDNGTGVASCNDTRLGYVLERINKVQLISLLSRRDKHDSPAICDVMNLETLVMVFKRGLSEQECCHLLQLQDKTGNTILHKIESMLARCGRVKKATDSMEISLSEFLGFLSPSSLLHVFLIDNISGLTPLNGLMANAKLVRCLMMRFTPVERLDMAHVRNAFHKCLADGYFDTATEILNSLNDEGSRVRLLSSIDHEGNTPFHMNNNFTEILHTISPAAQQNLIMIQNHSGNTPYHNKLLVSSEMFQQNRNMLHLFSVQNNIGDTVLHQHINFSAQANTTSSTHNRNQYRAVKKVQTVKEVLELLISNMSPDDFFSIICLQNGKGETIIHSLAKFLSAYRSCVSQFGHSLTNFESTTKLAEMLMCLTHINRNQRYQALCLKDALGDTALHKLDVRNTDMFLSLLKCFDSIDERCNVLALADRNGDTLFHLIAESSYSTLKWTLEEIPPNFRLRLTQNQNNTGNSPLHLSARTSSVMTAKLLLGELNADDRKALIALKDKKGNTAIQVAIMSSNFVCVKYILDLMGLPTMLEVLGISSECSILQEAISTENVDRIEHCLQNLGFEERCLISDLIEANSISNSNLRAAVDSLNEAEVQKLESFISESSPGTINEEIRKLSKLRFRHGNSIVHLLAERKDSQRLNKLLRACDDNQRHNLVSIRNNSGQVALESARTYKVRRLLEWSTQQAGFYYLPTQPVVVVLYTTEDREGADQETSELMKVLPDFNVHMIQRRDPKKQQILDAIREAQLRDDISALVVIIMSHGVQGSVCASDGDLSIQEILLQMCPTSLEGKPKVLMIQACQTRDQGLPSRVTAGVDPAPPAAQARHSPQASASLRQTSIVHDRTPEEYRIPSRDVITMMATVSGNLAYRNLMIPMFAEELRDSKDGDIYDIFLTTHYKMTEKLKNTPGQDQIPEFRSTLTQKLCLRNIFK